MKKKILIIGASGHAKVIIDIVELEGKYAIGGILDKNAPKGITFCGYEILGRDDDSAQFEGRYAGAIIAVGDNFMRSIVAAKVGRHLSFVSAIHPSATIARDAKIGPGTVIMAGARVNPGCAIGEHCILNTGSSLDHDSTLDDFASLAPGAITGGNCHIGEQSAISIGAVLRHGITIGQDTVVGAGALVLENIPANVVAYGTPARTIRERNRGDKYL
jgi:sugar O-acyltransferase (sialic acid O-acetyltransferase NeuD family)